MKKIIVGSLLILLGIWIGCSDDDPTSTTTLKKYPTELGNEWEYSTTFTLIFYDSSGNVYGNDTLFIGNTIAKVIEQDVTLGNIKDLVVINSYDLDTPQNINYVWYSNSSSGLSGIAYAGAGSSQPILPKCVSKISDLMIQNLFKQNLNPLLDITQRNSFDDSLQYYDPVRKVLVYPLAVGKTWIQTISPFTIKRTIQSKTIVETPAGSFNCFKIRTEIEEFPNSTYEDFINTDVGLILRKTEVDSMAHITELGDTIGFFNATSISELIRRE